MRAPMGLAILFSLLVIGCGRKVSHEECLLLLDRYTEKVIDQARPTISASERIEKVQMARRKSEMDPLFADCSREVSRREYECAMKANNADEIERCLM